MNEGHPNMNREAGKCDTVGKLQEYLQGMDPKTPIRYLIVEDDAQYEVDHWIELDPRGLMVAL